MEGARPGPRRELRVMGQARVTMAELLHLLSPIAFRVTEKCHQELDQVHPELTLSRLGRLVEIRVPRLRREPAVAGCDARVPDRRVHQQREVWRRGSAYALDVVFAEPTMPAGRAVRADPTLVGPVAQRRGMNVQALGGFVQAEPSGVAGGPGHGG